MQPNRSIDTPFRNPPGGGGDDLVLPPVTCFSTSSEVRRVAPGVSRIGPVCVSLVLHTLGADRGLTSRVLGLLQVPGPGDPAHPDTGEDHAEEDHHADGTGP